MEKDNYLDALSNQQLFAEMERCTDELKAECGALIFREYHLVAALKAYMFLEQTNAGKNPHPVGSNRYRAFQLGRYALALVQDAELKEKNGNL